jgi:hypothetical protein
VSSGLVRGMYWLTEEAGTFVTHSVDTGQVRHSQAPAGVGGSYGDPAGSKRAG